MPPGPSLVPSTSDDVRLVARIACRDHTAFEALMRRYNGRLFRVARAILRDAAEAEDAVQDAYLDAYRHAGEFRGEAEVTTWLTRIVVNRALMRLRRHKRDRLVVPLARPSSAGPEQPGMDVADRRTESPSDAALRGEIRQMLERRIDELPAAFRAVFVMRDVEDMTVQETADCLAIPAATVRTRLFRARALLRTSLQRDVDTATLEVFGFAGARCDRIVFSVLAKVAQL